MSCEKYFEVAVYRGTWPHVQEAIECTRVYDDHDAVAVRLMQDAMAHYRCEADAEGDTPGVFVVVYSGVEGVVGRDVRYVGMI